jgi:hypothetical protein
MFNKKKPNAETIRNLKLVFSKKHQIPEKSILSMAELSCHEPNCPPIETIITRESRGWESKELAYSKSPLMKFKEIDI